MPFPLAPHHVQLVSACYPPSSALLSSGPEYKPNSQELSRLLYYASNRPGKLAKLSSELDKRITTDARRAKAGNGRARASMLITLNIFKALVTECRRDLSLFSTPLMSTLNTSLGSLPGDLEVCAKVATVFTAWATYTNGQLLGVDQALTRDYLSTLRTFASMCTTEARSNDTEDRNRTRLIGLGAMAGAVASEALYTSSTQFRAQVAVIVPAFVCNVLQSDIYNLEHESEAGTDYLLPLSPFLTDFRSRPLLERRAASIHAHTDGDSGPSMKDITNVSVKALACLFNQSNGTQVGLVIRALFDSLGLQKGWSKADHCCWLAQKAVGWTRYQYRFAIPVRLVDRLTEAQNDADPQDLHKTLTKMIKAVLTAPTPLANLSTSDLCTNLTALVLRRIVINPHDELLPALVDCLGALGSHIYYADQIHDLACEIIGRLVNIEVNGLPRSNQTAGPKDEGRIMALKCLIAALGLLIKTSSGPTANTTYGGLSGAVVDMSRPGSPTSSDAHSSKDRYPQRSRISVDVWQETLTLLCHESVHVRIEYAKALLIFINSEIRSQNDILHPPDGAGPSQTNGSMTTNPPGTNLTRPAWDGDGNTDRFINALLASLFVLATSSNLDIAPSSPPSPSSSLEIDRERDGGKEVLQVNVTPSTPMQSQTFATAEDQSPEAPLGSQSSRRKSLSFPQTRKLYRIRWLLENSKRDGPPATNLESLASLSDYVHILAILDALHEKIPIRTLLLGFPMLSALRSWCNSDTSRMIQCTAIRELVIRHGKTIADIWSCEGLRNCLNDVPLQEAFTAIKELTFLAAEEPLSLRSLESSSDKVDWPCDTAEMITVLSDDETVQRATGLEENSLRQRLEEVWSPEAALRESMEHLADSDVSSRLEHTNPLLKISPALMHISNLSLQSLTRSNRAVGVNDLRDALEGRAGASSVAIGQGRAPSIASLGATISGASGESHAGYPALLAVPKAKTRVLIGENPGEVKEVLDKLGIGGHNKMAMLGNERVKGRLRSNRPVLVPPYSQT